MDGCRIVNYPINRKEHRKFGFDWPWCCDKFLLGL